MPIRDVIVTLIIFGLLPVCFARPHVGILVWTWIGLMNPHRMTWGFAHELPFALIVGTVTLAGWLLARDRRPIPRTPEVYLVSLLWIVFTFTSLFAIRPEEAWEQWSKVSKIFLMFFVALTLFQDRRRLRLLLLVTVLSLGFWGVKSGLWGLFHGPDTSLRGPLSSFFGANVPLALTLNMTLPLLILAARTEQHVWFQRLMRVSFVLTAVGVVATAARSGILGLGAVLTMLLLRSRSKLIVVGLFAFGVAFVLPSLPTSWWERMETIEHYEEDLSARQRLAAWRLSYLIALDRPLTGGGFGVYGWDMYEKYVPDMVHAGDAHSIYFQMLGEHGFPGLILFLALLAMLFRSLARLRSLARSSIEHRWLAEWPPFLEASLVGYMVSGAFVNLAYFDVFYHLVLFVVLLNALAMRPTVEVTTATPSSQPGRATRLPSRHT